MIFVEMRYIPYFVFVAAEWIPTVHQQFSIAGVLWSTDDLSLLLADVLKLQVPKKHLSLNIVKWHKTSI